jgi:hypothetical protein
VLVWTRPLPDAPRGSDAGADQLSPALAFHVVWLASEWKRAVIPESLRPSMRPSGHRLAVDLVDHILQIMPCVCCCTRSLLTTG